MVVVHVDFVVVVEVVGVVMIVMVVVVLEKPYAAFSVVVAFWFVVFTFVIHFFEVINVVVVGGVVVVVVVVVVGGVIVVVVVEIDVFVGVVVVVGDVFVVVAREDVLLVCLNSLVPHEWRLKRAVVQETHRSVNILLLLSIFSIHCSLILIHPSATFLRLFFVLLPSSVSSVPHTSGQ